LTAIVVAIVDTGLAPERFDARLLVPGVNLSLDGPEHDTLDRHGHGTLVASTVVAAAPGARVMPVKLMGDRGYLRSGEQLEASFEWILEHRAARHIGVVCASFADASHLTTDESFRGTRLQQLIAALREAGVPTVAPAGNGYPLRRRESLQGMAWPAILREVVSAGALESGAEGMRLSRASQRLHADLGTGCSTTVFAEPGPPGGTSGAAAVVAGRLAVLRAANPVATVDELVARLLNAGFRAPDEDSLAWPALSSPWRKWINLRSG